jgi:hypothetical protein
MPAHGIEPDTSFMVGNGVTTRPWQQVEYTYDYNKAHN